MKGKQTNKQKKNEPQKNNSRYYWKNSLGKNVIHEWRRSGLRFDRALRISCKFWDDRSTFPHTGTRLGISTKSAPPVKTIKFGISKTSQSNQKIVLQGKRPAGNSNGSSDWQSRNESKSQFNLVHYVSKPLQMFGLFLVCFCVCVCFSAGRMATTLTFLSNSDGFLMGRLKGNLP